MVFAIADVEQAEDPQGETEDEEMKDGNVVGGLNMRRGVTRMHDFRMRAGRVERESVGA